MRNLYLLINDTNKEYLVCIDFQISSVNVKELFVLLNGNLDLHLYGFDIVKFLVRDEIGSVLSDLVERGQVHDLKIMFQLVNLAYEGHVGGPSDLPELCESLIKRRLRCPIYDPSDVKGSFEILKCCHQYLDWKVRKIQASNELTHIIQVKAQYGLSKIEKLGFQIDGEKAHRLNHELEKQLQFHADILKTYGWEAGHQSEKKYFEVIEGLKNSYEINLPTTGSGKYSSAERFLSEYSHIPFFGSYVQFQSLRKLQSTYVSKLLDQEVLYPNFNVLVNTGRTSSYNPNFQNFPKDQVLRECFIPRKGFKFLIADYSTIELCALAQTCINRYGKSMMADLINDGQDLHKWFASVVLNKSIESVTKEERTYAKACNFGFPGGLGVHQFLEYAKHTYGIMTLDIQTAKNLKHRWMEAFPEMKQYLQADGFRGKVSSSTITGRIRANCTFTQAKNFPFQGLAADGAKLGLFRLIQKGFRIVNYVHDEFVIELSLNELDRRAECEEIMISEMNVVCPDLKIRIESGLSDFWNKL